MPSHAMSWMKRRRRQVPYLSASKGHVVVDVTTYGEAVAPPGWLGDDRHEIIACISVD